MSGPNHTLIPNAFMGEPGTPGQMVVLSAEELRLYLAVMRLTAGRLCRATWCSPSQIGVMCGLDEKEVLTVAACLEEQGLIRYYLYASGKCEWHNMLFDAED